MNNQDGVMVSVIMSVYNHEKYVAHAIESILMQKTKFKYELVIGEDCSTDNSRSIIRKYQEQYPDIIRVIYQSRNKGKLKNSNMIRRRAKGKYWAFCEGDDYWTDCSKLQKQVDFLEKHNEYTAVYHNVLCVDKKGRPCRRKSINRVSIKPENRYFFYADMLKGGEHIVGHTSSLVCRNLYKMLGDGKNIRRFEICNCNGDRKLCATLACMGDIYLLGDVMSNYRVVLKEGSSWSALTYNKNMLLISYNSYIEICSMIKDIFNKNCRDKNFLSFLWKSSFDEFLRNPNYVNMSIFLVIFIRYIKDIILSDFDGRL